LEEAVKKHLEEERSRIQKLSDKIHAATIQLQAVNTKDEALLGEISDATTQLTAYKPIDIFEKLSKESKGGKRMKRSRRSNRGRKSVRK